MMCARGGDCNRSCSGCQGPVVGAHTACWRSWGSVGKVVAKGGRGSCRMRQAAMGRSGGNETVLCSLPRQQFLLAGRPR